jgi:hypothetical protein
MIEAVMLWNEPNNESHWDVQLDPGWRSHARMTSLAGAAVAAERPGLTRVLGGISPIDPGFVTNMAEQGGLEHVDAVAVHGFPLDWNHWQLDQWPSRLAEIRAVTTLPVWISEVGVSSFGAEEVQEFGLQPPPSAPAPGSARRCRRRAPRRRAGPARSCRTRRCSPRPGPASRTGPPAAAARCSPT